MRRWFITDGMYLVRQLLMVAVTTAVAVVVCRVVLDGDIW
jgi:hypothetical protein